MGAPIERDSWGGTPLHDAAENGHVEVHSVEAWDSELALRQCAIEPSHTSFETCAGATLLWGMEGVQPAEHMP